MASRCRKQDFERAALAGFAVNVDGPFVSADNPQHGGKAQPAACEFRGKKRIENPGPGFFVHPLACVRDFERKVSSRLERGEAEGAAHVVVVNLFDGCADADGTGAVAARLGRIDHQVHENLLQLRGIGLDGRQFVG